MRRRPAVISIVTGQRPKKSELLLRSLSIACIPLLLFFFSCEENKISQTQSKPEWAPTMDDDMLVVINKYLSYQAPPITTLTVEQARSAPTMAKAAKDVMMDRGIPPINYRVKEFDRTIEGPSPDGILVRVYTPETGNGPFPVIVYFHGGGWVVANLDVYESSAKALSAKANAIVISVEYRKAPEHKFPAAHEDAYAAYKWARVNAGILNGDTAKVAVAGESAGGNLASAVCLMARERGLAMPVHQLLVYPIADHNFNTESYQKNVNAQPLNPAVMKWFFDKYLNNPSDGDKPWISLVTANVTGLPPATIIGAEIDPLQSEGETYANRLKDAGIDVVYHNYTGVTHEFFGLTEVVSDARDAQDLAASRLREKFNNSNE